MKLVFFFFYIILESAHGQQITSATFSKDGYKVLSCSKVFFLI
jgi:hypothetical protein